MNQNDDMNGSSFEELFKKEKPDRKRLLPGQKLEAEVTGITKENIFLDVGGKGEGILDLKELLDGEGQLTVRIGDTITAYFLQSTAHGMLFTTRLGAGSQAKAHLHEAFRGGIPVEGLVQKEIKGGYEVTVAETRTFCPFSQMDLHRAATADSYLGQHFSFKIIEYAEGGRNIILSRRALLEEAREEQKTALRASLHEGDIVKGTITSIREFGAFVDIGGMDGLIPLSEISWQRPDDLQEILTIGQEVTVVVLKMDWDKERLTLSLKGTQPDPWNDAAVLVEGSQHTGSVTRLTSFGAFVTLKPGIDGLLHISKLGKGRRLSHPREALQQGQTLEVVIDGVDRDQKRLSLSLAEDRQRQQEESAETEDFKKYLQTDRKGQKEKLGSLGDILADKLRGKNK